MRQVLLSTAVTTSKTARQGLTQNMRSVQPVQMFESARETLSGEPNEEDDVIQSIVDSEQH